MRKMKRKITILFSAVLMGIATLPTIPVCAEENLTLGDVNGDGDIMIEPQQKSSSCM